MEDLYNRSTYDIGQDFKIEIVSNHFESGKVDLISEGFYEIYKWENSTLNVDVKSVVTWAYGKCYKLIFHSNLIGYSYLSINLTLKDNLKSKPKALQIFITSEKNSDGVVPGIWFEGKEMLIESNFGQNYELWINLGLKRREYLPEISKCTNSTFYDCIGYFLNRSKRIRKKCLFYNFFKCFFWFTAEFPCSEPCTPFIWKEITNYNHMPICESIKTNNCMHPPYYVALTESFKHCVGSCNQVEYNGHVSKWYYTENISENTALWNLVFSSKNIATEKESLGR